MMVRGSKFTSTTNLDGHLSISPSPTPLPRKDALGNSRKLRKSRPTPTHALSTISSDEQDSDCYIVDHKSQESRAPRFHTRASIQVQRVSSFDVLPAVHLPEPFQPSNIDRIHDMHDSSAADVTLTNHGSYLELYPSSQHSSNSVPASISSVGSSSRRGRNTPSPQPKPLPSHDVIEFDDDEEEAVPRHDVIEISSDSDEEMDVDNMLTLNRQNERVLTSPKPKPSSSHSTSSPSSLDMEDSLFTPVPSSRHRRRVILDHVSVPPFPKGLNMTDYKSSSNVSSIASCQGVEFLSVGDALAAAFAQNNRSPSPSLDRKGKGRERERETTPPAPVRPKRNKRLPPRFGEGISTVPTTILNVHYPLIELEIPDLPPHPNDTWHRNTYWIERVRFKRHHTELHQGLPEMIAQMKNLGGSGNEQDNGPILPRVFAPLFERRADIAASLAVQWEYASPKHSRRGKNMNASETRNIPSSSNSVTSFPTLLNDDISTSHFPVLEEGQPLDFSTEMDQYLNDLGDSPPKSHRIGHPRSAPDAYCGGSYLTSFLHNTTQLPPNVTSGARDDAADSFLGVPPSPKDESNLPSPLHMDLYRFDHSHTLDDSFEHVFPEEGTWSMLPDVEQEAVLPKTISPPESASTIDPSLLGGNEPPPKSPPSPIPPNSTLTPEKRAPDPIIYVRRPAGVSASQEAPAQSTVTGKSGRNVQIKYRTSGSASPIDEDNVVPKKDVAGVAGCTVTGPPVIPGARPSLKTRIRRPGTGSSSDGSFVPSQPSTSASPVVTSTLLSETRHPKVQEPIPAPRTLQKEKPKVFESSYCHHCRGKTARPKMQCSKRRQDRQICGKLFCNRCIIHRYPDMTFDRFSKTFVCPVCTDTCNCSVCARKRGDEYISMRGGGFAGLRAKSGIVLLPDASPSGQAQDVRTIPEPPTSAPQTMFWAHVYGLEGERVGRAFIGDASTISAPTMQPAKGGAPNGISKQKQKPTQKPKPKPKPIAKLKPKKPRVFIGLPLHEWKVRTFRDLEPSAPIPPLVAEEETYVGKGKGKAVERPRVYIGDARWLYVPCARMPVSPQSSRASSPEPGDELDSDGSLTPLEDLEEAMDWPQPDVGDAVTVTWPGEEVCERSASARLSPDDVEKAIGFALAVTL